MKKSLIALSVAGAFLAAGAQAADVQIYGLIDQGFSYQNYDADDGKGSVSTFSMNDAMEFGSRWGIRGSEDLGNGLKVGFTLESGFRADTGAMDNNGRLFGRESTVSLSGGFGTLTFGNMPVFGSTLGANGLFRAIDPVNANQTNAFGSGAATASSWLRADNTISYKTPTFAGLTGYAMYSFKMNTKNTADAGTEGQGGQSDRYAALALRYLQGPVEAILVADTTMYGTKNTTSDNQNPKNYVSDADNAYTVTLGGNYTFDNGLKVLAFGQYFENVAMLAKGGPNYAKTGSLLGGYGIDMGGYGLGIGMNMPALGGKVSLGLNYRDMTDDATDIDYTRWSVAAGYDYALSKRTSLYAMTGYSEEEKETVAGATQKPTAYELCLGIVHRF